MPEEVSSVWAALGSVMPEVGRWKSFPLLSSGTVFVLAFNDLPLDAKNMSYLMLRREFLTAFAGVVREKEYFVYPDVKPFIFCDSIPSEYINRGLTIGTWLVRIASKRKNQEHRLIEPTYSVTLLES